MFIGDLLIGLGAATQDELAAGLDLQQARGGALADRLIDLGTVKAADVEAAIATIPPSPRTVADTGLAPSLLLNLLIKTIYATSVETPSEMCELLKLPPRAILELLDDAAKHQLINVLGAIRADTSAERRYALTSAGMEWAHSAMRQCEYVGPAPVPLAAYREQICRQRITNETIDQDAIDQHFDGLIVSDDLVSKIGPAINSGRSILFYGPPGNGKTSVAERIGSLFKNVIYIPYAFEVDGQIVKVFDPGIHKSIRGLSGETNNRPTLHREDFDERWEACWRPIIFTGGELTLEMLDLGYNEQSKFYEAPLHIKALGGVFLIDDFGRQLVKPDILLNRWIVPLESRVDYMKLHSGKSFDLPFDELVIFSTNMSPDDLMDPAFLRRIPYKIEIAAPSVDEFHRIFHLTAEKAGVTAPDDVVNEVVAWLGECAGGTLAAYQPKFIIEQVLAASRFAKAPPQFQPRFLSMALSNLQTRRDPPAVNDIARIPRAKPHRAGGDHGQYAERSAA
ncbi:MAG TPA: hypothetical protein VGH15_12585 [Caulobacteraceae bacterium]|jgi:hypothetical protein